MILPLIARCPYLSAQPWSPGVVYPVGRVLYNPRREIAVVEPGPAADPFAGRFSDSLPAAVGVVWRPAGSRAKSLPGIESP
jgi:hypothetical protein